MKGLPDIDHTLIAFTNGQVVSSGEVLFRFAPMLRENTGVDFSEMHTIRYDGSFIGYIDNFAADGTLVTNLGTIRSQAKLSMPHFDTRQASYYSEITATNFQIGTFTHQPSLGMISFKGSISGSGFEPHNAAVKVNADIGRLGINGYDFTGIYADGVLERNKFDGKLLINDPNLSMSFQGSADISGKEPVINAEAHLLSANLKAIGLTKDSVAASADFDVDATGSSIDNFLGRALLNNINIIRNGHRIDIDSILLQSTADAAGQKIVSIESNDFSVSAVGNFEVSKLPFSAQYIAAQYLPSYIPSPKKFALNQDLKFSVSTRKIDSLLSVLMPSVKGFDSASIRGSLNTTGQLLSLQAEVPSGAIGNVRFRRLRLKGEGNFEGIKINGEAASVMVGDTLLQISLDLNADVAHDSIGFNVTTTSPETYGTATLNGKAVALGDSILVTMEPSEFFLNRSRWGIDGGSGIVYRPGHLSVSKLRLSSGLQTVNIYSRNSPSHDTLFMDAANLDLAQIGNIGGLTAYNADGRVNGTISVTDLFTEPYAKATVKASHVLLGADTIGDIIVIGNYNGKKGVVSLEKGSGIFHNNSSLTAEGTIAFDKSTTQSLDGKISLHDLPVAWLNPFLAGFVSRMSGSANGDIGIGGTGLRPAITGSISLEKAALKVDYLGAYYTIPAATIDITNTSFNLGSVTLHDQYDNTAVLTGKITHDRFHDFRLGLNMKSDEFEVLNLQDYESSVFYGHLIANVKSLSVSGPVDDVRMNIIASPADISHLYLPVASGGDIGTYTYVTFKKYGEQQSFKIGSRSKLTINIDAIINPLAEVTLILDPTTGDAINARGTGNLRLEVPAGGDLRMYGNFNIDQGDYTFTFRQLFFKRQFSLLSGSSVHFSGPINQTTLDVSATYRTRASLYDLLSENEKNSSFIPAAELSDTKRQQDVDVLLTMKKNILHPELSFQLALPEKRSVGTYAYTKFERLNSNERELFNQVASLLLIGYFIAPEGIGGANAAAGAINNISEILSTSTSAQLTNIVNKLLGDPKLSVDLKYKNYNVSDVGLAGPINRNEVKLGLRKNLLNDRLILEVGSSYDWGRPVSTAATSSNFNLLNDFRIQYLLSKDGRLRFNGFRTTDYDVLVSTNGGNITRSGIGISWRKTFDSFGEFLHSTKYAARQQKHMLEEQQKVDSTTIKKTIGTD